MQVQPYAAATVELYCYFMSEFKYEVIQVITLSCVHMSHRLPGMCQQGISGHQCSLEGAQAAVLSQAVVSDAGAHCDVGEW
jgi:hypothetical protein